MYACTCICVYACVRVRVRICTSFFVALLSRLPLLHTSNLTGIVDTPRTKERKRERNEALRKIHSQDSYSESRYSACVYAECPRNLSVRISVMDSLFLSLSIGFAETTLRSYLTRVPVRTYSASA